MANDDRGARVILEDELHAFVDDRLPDERRQEVQGYLDRHPEAADWVAARRGQRQALRGAFSGVAQEPLPSRLNLRRLVAEREAVRRRSQPWKIAAAVVLTLGLGGAGGWLARGESDAQVAGIASLSREASASYATYALDATRPVEIDGAHKAQLARWVSDRLRRPVRVPDLSSSGYGLVGGRLVATEHGPAALFLYDDASGTRIAVLARPMSIERDTPQMRRNDGRFGGYSWADDGLGYGVVGNATAGDLHPLADEVRKQTRVSL